MKDCTKVLELNPTYFKALMRRAKLYEQLDQLDKALADYKELHELEPINVEVNCALKKLPKSIEKQQKSSNKKCLVSFQIISPFF